MPDTAHAPDRDVAAARTGPLGLLAIELAANSVGTLVVVAYLLLIYPVEDEGARVVGLNLIVFGAYVVVVSLVSLPVNVALLRRAVGWVRAGRSPTAAERRDTLLLPRRQVYPSLAGWVGAAAIFGVLNDEGARIAVGIALAGMLTCTLLFQILERWCRPLFALALDGTDPAALGARRREILPRIMVSWWIGAALPLLLIGIAPLTLPDDQLAGLMSRITSLVVLLLVGGGLVMRGAASSVAEPVDEVRQAMSRVQEGDLDVHVEVDYPGEIGRLQAGFDAMVAGLDERRRVEDLFGRLVGTEVARQALERGPQLGGEEREITALFVDRAGFTAFAEHASPVEIVGDLNRLFAVVIDVVEAEGGWVNKFEGDAALCLFGAPAAQPDHARRALRAAQRLPAAVAELEDHPKVGVGVATGRVVAGHIGTADRYEYTVIGDAVNVASRLTDLAKTRPTHVLAAGTSVAAALAAGADPEDWQPLEVVHVRGRRAAIEVWVPSALLERPVAPSADPVAEVEPRPG